MGIDLLSFNFLCYCYGFLAIRVSYLIQVLQMLTMRNGLSLYPICVPGMLQSDQVSQMRADVYDTNKYSDVNMMKQVILDQNILADSLLRLPENFVKQELVSDFSTMLGSKTSMEVESIMQQQHHLGAFQLSRSFQVGAFQLIV